MSSFASLRPRLRSRRPVIVAGIIVVGLLGGAGAALATTGSGTPAAAPSVLAATPTPAPTPSAVMPPRAFGHGFRGFAGAGFGGPARLFGALHGQIVVAKPGGGYQTVDFQNGQVTAVSATSVTVKSADGYSRSYVITASTVLGAQRDGIGSVKVGNQVSLSATVAGSTATAVAVQDITLLQQSRQAFGYGGRGGANWPGGPAPSGGQAR